jgi:hypothetical protein
MSRKLAKFRPFEPRRRSQWAATYSNDNLPGFRRLEGRRRRPIAACYWVLIDGRLECRWAIDENNPDHTRPASRRAGAANHRGIAVAWLS